MFLKDDYLLKKKKEGEVFLLDILDSHMISKERDIDYPI